MVTQYLKQIGKMKKPGKRVPYELTKNSCFEVLSSLTVHNNSELFLNRIVTCNEKWILYDNWQQPAQWLDGEEALKTSQSQTCPPKRPWSLFGGLLPV